MQGAYSMRSPAVKRLMKEAQELREPTEQYACHPLDDNLFEWHFTIRGPADSEFDGGLYHGRIILPPDYPMKPPSIILMTPNGRFETHKKICLSISGHHPESWQPSWSLRTALLAIIGFMPTHGGGALGSLDYTADERKALAKRSQDFKCPTCGSINNILKPVTEESKKTTAEAKELAAQIDFKDEKEKNAALKSTQTNADAPATETTTTTDSSSPSTPASTSNQQTFTPPPFTPPPPFAAFSPFNMQMPPPPFSTSPMPPGTTNPAAMVPRFPQPFISPMTPFYPMGMTLRAFVPGMPPMMPGMMPGMTIPPPWQNMMAGQQQNLQNPTANPFPSPASFTSSTSVSTNQTTESVPHTQNPTQRPPSPVSMDDSQSASTSRSNTTNNTSNTSSNISTNTSTNQEHEPETIGPQNTREGTSEGLRQRNVRPVPDRQSSSVRSQPRTAEVPTRTRSLTGDLALCVFALFVLTVIILLVIRRLRLMNLFPTIL